MGTLAHGTDTSKLLSMVGNVELRNKAYRRVRYSPDKTEKDRQYGRLNASIKDLREAADKLQGGQP